MRLLPLPAAAPSIKLRWCTVRAPVDWALVKRGDLARPGIAGVAARPRQRFSNKLMPVG